MSVKKTTLAAAQALADTATGHGADWVWVRRAVVRQAVNLGSLRRGLRMPWPLPPGAHVPPEAVDVCTPILTGMDADLTDMAAVGRIYEVLLEHDLVDGQVVRSTDPDRRAVGIYYTPTPLAASMTRLSLQAALRGADQANPDAGADAVLAVNAFDPACGAGVFLVSAVRCLAEEYIARGGGDAALPRILSECIFGVDIDPIAVDMARTALWWEIGGRAPITFMDDRVVVGNSLAGDEPPALAARYAVASQALPLPFAAADAIGETA